jgi:hypothetical protein
MSTRRERRTWGSRPPEFSKVSALEYLLHIYTIYIDTYILGRVYYIHIYNRALVTLLHRALYTVTLHGKYTRAQNLDVSK